MKHKKKIAAILAVVAALVALAQQFVDAPPAPAVAADAGAP
jgi:uncharacterized lipoprotein YbaY